MKKRLLVFVTALCLVLGMIPAVSAAVTDSGTCGENVTWTFDEETGTLTISGTGAMTDYSHTSTEEIPWNAFSGQITALVVEEGITSIGQAAFYQCSALSAVTLPSTLISIGDKAFSLCAITELELPDGLLTLGGFSYNPLTEVVIPDSVTTISKSAFFECTELTRVVLPAGLEVCADSAFSRCSSLSQVVMPEMPNFQRFGNSVFNACALTDISWYNQSTIYYQQFANNEMTEMTIPDCVTTIAIFAFEGCSSLTTVTFPAGISSIGAGAFAECAAMETVYFQGDAPEIGPDAFRGAVLTAYYPAGNDTWTEEVMQQYSGTITWTAYDLEPAGPGIIDSGTFGDNVTWTIYDDGNLIFSGTGPTYDGKYYIAQDWYRNADLVEHVIFEEGITYIGEYIFYDARSPFYDGIRIITIPASVAEIGEYAFVGMNGLEAVHISDLESWCRITFANAGANPLDNGAALYLNDVPVTDLEFPESVTVIPYAAFKGCTSLETVTIHEGIEEIGNFAFNTCENLETIYFRGNAPVIGENTFTLSTLTAYYPAGDDTWTEEVRQQYGGTVTWMAYDPDGEVTDPTVPSEPDPTDPEPSEPEPTEPDPSEPTEPIENPFTDVKKSAYYFEPVLWAVSNNITGGTSATTFSPNASCTRGQIVTFLWAAAGRPEPESSENPFSDVKKSAYYYKAVLWAVENGITSGTSATKFSPNAPCTRAQVVTFLWAAKGRPDPESTKNSFSDVKSSAYYYKSVLWAVENGITSGVGNGKFGPNQTCTRAQIVTFLYKAYEE